MIHSEKPLKLSGLMETYFDGEPGDMKCSVCCQHQSNCPLSGLCKMKTIYSSPCLSKIPNQLIIQLTDLMEKMRQGYHQ